MGINRDVISYSALISACEKGSQWPTALELFRSMKFSTLAPNKYSFSAAIISCQKGEQWQHALHLFSNMSAYELTPDAISFNATMASLKRGSQWQVAILVKPPMVIQVIYDARCSICLRAIQLVSFREETLRSNGVAPTVQLNSWPSSDAERVLQGIPSPSRPASLSSKVWALLPSGLILPENQDDPMRLIYEMEYMAFVRLPTPEINTRVENTVLTPLQQQLAKGGGKLPWWSSPESLQLIARALKMEHFAVVDGFLPEDVCEALEQGARGAKPEMVRGATGAASKAQGADLAKVLNQPSRGDVVKFSDDGQMPGCPDFLCALDALVDGLKSCRDVAPKLRYVDWANGAMFAIYPGGASRYIKHVDNTLGTDGRRLTAVLYLNRHWSPKDGGCLRIFEPTMQNCQAS
eukprot:symbB.v1.2.015768.t1/scaffold1181.1/size133410/4